MKNNADDDLIMRAAVARLSREDLSQTVIAEMLDISQSQVSKYLKNNQFIKKIFTLDALPKGNIRDNILSQVDERLNHGHVRPLLRALSRSPYLKVDVVYREVSDAEEMNGFDPETGRRISRLLERANTVGVAWELDIAPPDRYEHASDFHVRDGTKRNCVPIHFVPLAGISVSSKDVLTKSSSVIAMKFDTIVNRNFKLEDRHKIYNLNCIPLIHSAVTKNRRSSYIDTHLPDSEDVISYIEQTFTDYIDIFGALSGKSKSSKKIIDNVDTIFTGLGSVEGSDIQTTLDNLYPELRKGGKSGGKIDVVLPKGRERIELDDLKANYIVGDIAGILLPRPGVNYARNIQVVEFLNNRLATLRSEHLVACHKRHMVAYDKKSSGATSDDPPAGVVLIAKGAEKADAVICALAQGYVSRLIIDRPLEEELSNRAKNLNAGYTDYLQELGVKVADKTTVNELLHATVNADSS